MRNWSPKVNCARIARLVILDLEQLQNEAIKLACATGLKYGKEKGIRARESAPHALARPNSPTEYALSKSQN